VNRARSFGAAVLAVALLTVLATPASPRSTAPENDGSTTAWVNEDADDSANKARDDRDSWDPEVHELVAFIEQTRGPFDEPVPIRFISEAEYLSEAAGLGTASGALPEIELVDDYFRALGLTDRADDPFAAFAASAVPAGLFDRGAREVLVITPAGNRPTTLSLSTQAVLVHELTHAWQFLAAEGRRAVTNDYQLAPALLEGEATWIARRWVERLSEVEHRELFEQDQRSGSFYIDEDPLVDALVVAPYLLGPMLMRVRYELGGDEAVELLFRVRQMIHVPRLLLDPFNHDRTEVFAEFERAPLADETDLRFVVPMLEPLHIYLVLASAVPFADARTVALTLDAVSVPMATTTDGRVCISIVFTFPAASGEQVEDAFSVWALASPAHREWRQTSDGQGQLIACDPGAGVPEPRADPRQAISWLYRYISAELWLQENRRRSDATLDLTVCLATPEPDEFPLPFDVGPYLEQLEQSTCAGRT